MHTTLIVLVLLIFVVTHLIIGRISARVQHRFWLNFFVKKRKMLCSERWGLRNWVAVTLYTPFLALERVFESPVEVENQKYSKVPLLGMDESGYEDIINLMQKQCANKSLEKQLLFSQRLIVALGWFGLVLWIMRIVVTGISLLLYLLWQICRRIVRNSVHALFHKRIITKSDIGHCD